MKTINLDTWNRKQHYEHFCSFSDPYFGITVPFDVTKAYKFSKDNHISFFGKYLHACMLAINEVDNFKYRIIENSIVEYDKIHASATIMRKNKTFAFSFINFNEDLNIFLNNLNIEKKRIDNSKDLYPPINGLDCIHCSAIPWLNFKGHKEPVSGLVESVPKLGFSKVEKESNKLVMNVSINVNHALIDAYHVSQFSEKFQDFLNNKN